MARRKSDVRTVEFSHGEPPQDLLRFVPVEDRPWDSADFAAFLRAREAWRDTHSRPLPELPALERAALHRLQIPTALVQAEGIAPTAVPSAVFSHPEPEEQA